MKKSKERECPACEGNGRHICTLCGGFGVLPSPPRQCTLCKGTGRQTCTSCGGGGQPRRR